MKRLFFVLIFLGFAAIAVLSYAIPADVIDISGTDYFPAVHKALNEAKKSIFLVMYYIEFRKDEPESKVSILVNDLIKAKARGITVKVILDQNISYRKDSAGRKDFKNDEKNRRAFNYLKEKGIDVSYDNIEINTHGKCIVIDEEDTIVASHNWTKNSLLRNNEYAALIKVKEYTESILKRFEKIQIDHEASRKEAEEYVELDKNVMINILSGFVSKSNDYCWDVYLYLIGHYQTGEEIDFDYEKVAQYFGLDKRMNKEDYREMLGYQTLKELQDKYGLVTYTPVKGQNARVMINEQGGDKIEIPKKFWAYGWDRTLSLSGQFCYFVNLAEGGESNKTWSMSKENLIKKYRVGKERFSEGMAELRQWNLAEIEYGSTDSGNNFTGRMPNRYSLKDLYRVEDFELELQKLYEKYGKDKVEAARGYAKIIFSENNLTDVEEIIRMIAEYGEEKIDWAFNKIANRSEDNPKRTMGYVIGILRSSAKL